MADIDGTASRTSGGGSLTFCIVDVLQNIHGKRNEKTNLFWYKKIEIHVHFLWVLKDT